MEIASLILLFTSKRDFWTLLAEQRRDLLVGDIADLIVVVHNLTILVTDTAFAGFHECVAGFIVSTDVAIDASPALVAIA